MIVLVASGLVSGCSIEAPSLEFLITVGLVIVVEELD